MAGEPKIAPSILSADFSRLGEQVALVATAGADQIHVDVMDGHFVENITMGPLVVRALRKATELPLDVHLMITDPLRHLDPFIDAGADNVTFHVEANSEPMACIEHLRRRGVGVGLAISPGTPVDRILELVSRVDMMLVMTVCPGRGGQSLIPETLEKIPPIRRREDELRSADPCFGIDIQVDGGIDLTTMASAARAGANVFVAGSSIFGVEDPGAEVKAFKNRLEEIFA